MAQNQWIADRRIYLDRDGNAVEADNPARLTLLAGVGQGIPIDRARALGLVAPAPEPAPPAEPDEKAKAAPANKAKAAPANKAAEPTE